MKDFSTIELIKHNKALTAFSCLFIIVFILLGFWQIERAGFKANLIQEFDLEQAKAVMSEFNTDGMFSRFQPVERVSYSFVN